MLRIGILRMLCVFCVVVVILWVVILICLVGDFEYEYSFGGWLYYDVCGFVLFDWEVGRLISYWWSGSWIGGFVCDLECGVGCGYYWYFYWYL